MQVLDKKLNLAEAENTKYRDQVKSLELKNTHILKAQLEEKAQH